MFTDIAPKTMKKLEDTNSLFLANLFGVSKKGCPKVSLYTETSSLLIPNQILQNQLLFLNHMATLPTNTLAKETYTEMKEKDLPGLLKVCQKYLQEWNLTNVEDFSKLA